MVEASIDSSDEDIFQNYAGKNGIKPTSWIFYAVLALIELYSIYGLHLTGEDIHLGIRAAREGEIKRKDIETLLLGVEPFPDSAEDKQQSVLKANPISQQDDMSSEFILGFIDGICKSKRCTFQDLQNLYKLPLPDKLKSACHKDPKCGKGTKYRSIDGKCNNLKHPMRGSSQTAQIRMVYSDYDDFISKPRVNSIYGKKLPSSRKVSDVILTDIPSFERRATTAFTFFGQMLSHDIVLTPNVLANGSEILCCKNALKGFPSHPACFPISISKHDSFYSQFNRRCMEMVRSGSTINSKCGFSAREQENQITSFIDASFLYGSDSKTAHQLRRKKDGLMLVQMSDLLPEATTTGCNRNRNCPFHAGDIRSNENPGLAIHHTIFVRQHNKIAEKMAHMKPDWDDEKLYQETRKIMIAYLQNIVYDEYLPIALGPNLMKEFGLNLPMWPDKRVYNPLVDPSVLNEFSSAAFRMGHAMMSADFEMIFKDHKHVFKPLEDTLFLPWDLYRKQKFLAMVKGMTFQNPWKRTVHITSALTKKLFKAKSQKFGLDLASLNIQRARDHGIPPYNAVREACGFKFYKTFEDLPVSSRLRRRLKKVYHDVEDIDLFVGGLFEPAAPGSLLGETFACLWGIQFTSLMKGDRYFFTNGKTGNTIRSGHEYTMKQIAEFRKANLAKLFCDTTPITKIQEKVMEAPGEEKHSKDPEPHGIEFLEGVFNIQASGESIHCLNESLLICLYLLFTYSLQRMWKHLMILVCLAEIFQFQYDVYAKFSLSQTDVKISKTEADKSQRRTSILNKFLKSIYYTRPSSSLPIIRQHQLADPTEETERDDHAAERILDFITATCRRKRCTTQDKREFLILTLPEEFQVSCRKSVTCTEQNNIYRTYDGTCNNLKRPLEGSAPGPHARFIDPDYDDLIQSPRSKSVTGTPLPSPRLISDVVIKDRFIENSDFTTILTYFGQTIDHDFTMTPSVTGMLLEVTVIEADGDGIVCCPNTENSTPDHPACMPISIPRNDSFFRQFNQDCMEFVRSSAIENPDCRFGVRQQMNQITSFIDGSFMYGSDSKKANELRTKSKGLMKIGVKNLLPPNIKNGCTARSNTCSFLAGRNQLGFM
ncbi:Chorion peroxidase [Nymphon striatum]|nr:Chorion peroxidase [Nymphon striatum]